MNEMVTPNFSFTYAVITLTEPTTARRIPESRPNGYDNPTNDGSATAAWTCSVSRTTRRRGPADLLDETRDPRGQRLRFTYDDQLRLWRPPTRSIK